VQQKHVGNRDAGRTRLMDEAEMRQQGWQREQRISWASGGSRRVSHSTRAYSSNSNSNNKNSSSSSSSSSREQRADNRQQTADGRRQRRGGAVVVQVVPWWMTKSRRHDPGEPDGGEVG